MERRRANGSDGPRDLLFEAGLRVLRTRLPLLPGSEAAAGDEDDQETKGLKTETAPVIQNEDQHASADDGSISLSISTIGVLEDDYAQLLETTNAEHFDEISDALTIPTIDDNSRAMLDNESDDFTIIEIGDEWQQINEQDEEKEMEDEEKEKEDEEKEKEDEEKEKEDEEKEKEDEEKEKEDEEKEKEDKEKEKEDEEKEKNEDDEEVDEDEIECESSDAFPDEQANDHDDADAFDFGPSTFLSRSNAGSSSWLSSAALIILSPNAQGLRMDAQHPDQSSHTVPTGCVHYDPTIGQGPLMNETQTPPLTSQGNMLHSNTTDETMSTPESVIAPNIPVPTEVLFASGCVPNADDNLPTQHDVRIEGATSRIGAKSSLSLLSVTTIERNDFLLGRGHKKSDHDGNQRVRKEVVPRHYEMHKAASKKNKKKVWNCVIRDVRAHGGRFLKRVQGGEWVVADDNKARRVIGQLFREMKRKERKKREYFAL